MYDTTFDKALVYGSIALSGITVAMSVSEKTLHMMDADPGWRVLAAVYLCNTADVASRTLAVALLFALDTTGLALGLGAAGMVLLDLTVQVWQVGRRRKSKRDAGEDGLLVPESWREVEGCGGMKLGTGLIDGCCDCEDGLADCDVLADCDAIRECNGCICLQMKCCCRWPGLLHQRAVGDEARRARSRSDRGVLRLEVRPDRP